MKPKRDGSILRSPKGQRKYHNYIVRHKVEGCDFCAYNESSEVVAEHIQFLVIKNMFPYTVWDGMNVLDHLMLIPRRHITSLSELTADESKEYMELLGSYEDAGYSAYSRSHKNNMKTVPHQHTHLLKTGSKQKKLMVFVRKPHVLISR